MASESSMESPRLCANGCGFFGRPETHDLCSKCYRELCAKEVAAAVLSYDHSSSGDSTCQFPVEVAKPVLGCGEDRAAKGRCARCNKKLGLVEGFQCRCEGTYCAAHRHPEVHACTFDFKTVGRDALAKANPVVKADKLQRI